MTAVDVADTAEVVETFLEWLVQMQTSEGPAVYVIPIRPLDHDQEVLARRIPALLHADFATIR